MPELPEVEFMRRVLVTLKSPDDKRESHRLRIERVKDNPPKNFLSDAEIDALNDNCTVVDVTRKGKLLCMELECFEPIDVTTTKDEEETTTKTKHVYLFLHMAMTGRIASPSSIPNLEELKETTEYPLPNTYLTFNLVDKTSGDVLAEASFSDPRKFGQVVLDVNQDRFEELAPDALLEMKGDALEEILNKLTEQSKPIKALLLDQKRAVSGVGNWIADEVAFQCELHPEQKNLSREEAQKLVDTLSSILETAVACYGDKEEFPRDWMFNYRWEKKRAQAKDSKGRQITFIKSGGRTSAIVASIQKEQGRSRKAAKKTKADSTTKDDEGATSTKKRKPAAAKKEEVQDEDKQKSSTSKKKRAAKNVVKTEEAKDSEKERVIDTKKQKTADDEKETKNTGAASKRKKADSNTTDKEAEAESKKDPKKKAARKEKEEKESVSNEERPRRYPRRSTRARG